MFCKSNALVYAINGCNYHHNQYLSLLIDQLCQYSRYSLQIPVSTEMYCNAHKSADDTFNDVLQ